MTQDVPKSSQKSPGWLKWQVLRMKPESTGEGGGFICGWGIIGSGGVLFWDTNAKCKSAGRPACAGRSHLNIY